MDEKVQAASGLVIGCYTIAHLLNHASIHFGIETHHAIFRVVHRLVVKNRIVESILLLAILLHSLISIKRYKGVAPGGAKLLHQVTGWVLLFSMPGHIFFTRVEGPKLFPVGSEYNVEYASMTSRVLPYFFVPYYALLAMSGAVHTFSGLARAGRILHLKFIENNVPFAGPKFWNISKILAVIALSSSLGLSGVYFRFPMEHEALLMQGVKRKFPKFLSSRLNLSPPFWFARLQMTKQ